MCCDIAEDISNQRDQSCCPGPDAINLFTLGSKLGSASSITLLLSSLTSLPSLLSLLSLSSLPSSTRSSPQASTSSIDDNSFFPSTSTSSIQSNQLVPKSSIINLNRPPFRCDCNHRDLLTHAKSVRDPRLNDCDCGEHLDRRRDPDSRCFLSVSASSRPPKKKKQRKGRKIFIISRAEFQTARTTSRDFRTAENRAADRFQGFEIGAADRLHRGVEIGATGIRFLFRNPKSRCLTIYIYIQFNQINSRNNFLFISLFTSLNHINSNHFTKHP